MPNTEVVKQMSGIPQTGGDSLWQKWRRSRKKPESKLPLEPQDLLTETSTDLHGVDAPIIGGEEAALNGVADRGVFAKEQKIELTWGIKPIQRRHIDQLIRDRSFADTRRAVHMKGDLITDEVLQMNWSDEDQVEALRQRLYEYYLIQGQYPFEVRATNDAGRTIQVVDVIRRTFVAEKGEILAGMTSWLVGKKTGDPWSRGSKPRRAHTQMHWVEQRFSGQGIGLFLAIARTDKIFGIGSGNPDKGLPIFPNESPETDGRYEEIVTWVNITGNYQVNENLFDSLGYNADAQIYINTTDPKKSIRMRRYVLKKDVWINGATRPDGKRIGREAAIARWELKKKGLTHHEPNLG